MHAAEHRTFERRRRVAIVVLEKSHTIVVQIDHQFHSTGWQRQFPLAGRRLARCTIRGQQPDDLD